MRFEPTPATGGAGITTPTYTGPEADNPTPTPSGSSSSRPAGNRAEQDLADIRGDKGVVVDLPTSSASLPADWWRAWVFGGLVVLALLAALIPAARRVLRRRRRLGAEADVEAAWSELRDSAIDVGAEWSDSRTPRQAVAALVDDQRLSGAAADAATRLGRTVERARYAPTPPDLTLVTDDVTTVRSAMLHRLDRRRRARATLAPASLRTAREDARV